MHLKTRPGKVSSSHSLTDFCPAPVLLKPPGLPWIPIPAPGEGAWLIPAPFIHGHLNRTLLCTALPGHSAMAGIAPKKAKAGRENETPAGGSLNPSPAAAPASQHGPKAPQPPSTSTAASHLSLNKTRGCCWTQTSGTLFREQHQGSAPTPSPASLQNLNHY